MKKKALILTILSSMTLAAGGLAVALSANQLGFIDSAAGEKVTGSILFSRATGSFTRIDETTSSTSATTGSGATYYAIAHSNSDVESTGYIATFGNGKGYDEMYIDFTTSPIGGTPFEFQKITGIKITTASSGDQTLYAYYSSDGVNFNNSYAVTCNSNPQKVTFDSPQKYVRVGTGTVQGRYIVSVELFYECGEDPEPGEKTVESIAPDYIAGVKQNYVLGDDFEPAPVKVNYSDGSSETITTGPSYDGFNLSETGKQTVTITYAEKSVTYPIFVRPSATAMDISYTGFSMIDYEYHNVSEFLDLSESVLPEYGEPGEKVYITTKFKPAYILQGFYEEYDTTIYTDGDVSWFVMPSRNITWEIAYNTNPNKQLSYVGFDLGSYDSADISIFIDSSSVLPSQAEPGDTVSVTPVAKSGFAIDGVVDMAEEVTITENDGVYSFTMPSYNFEVTIMFHEVVTLESIYVKNPKTTYTVGSSFVIPTVMGVYSNGVEEALAVTAENFSGFDSSAEAEGQVITVSYPGVANTSYTIDITDGEEPTVLDCTYRIAQSSSTDYKLQFNDDNTGKYYRWYNSTESWAIAFTYTYDPATGAVSIELNHSVTYSQVNNFATGYRLVQANSTSGVISFVNDSGFINASNQFEIDMVKVSAGVFSTEHRTFTLA